MESSPLSAVNLVFCAKLHPAAQHLAGLVDFCRGEFVLPHADKMQILGQAHQNAQFVQLDARFLEMEQFTPALVGGNDLLQNFQDRVFNALAQNKSLRFGKFVDRRIQPQYQFVSFFKYR